MLSLLGAAFGGVWPVIIPLCPTLVRSGLEYCILFGVSQFNRDVKKLGRVWWRGTETVRAEGTCPARRSWGGWLA